MKLSRPQKIALDKLTAEWECSYTMGVSRKTSHALVKKGLAESRGEGSPRAIFAPTIAIEYRKALAT